TEVTDYLADCIQGECAYRQENPGPDRVGYTFLPPAREEDVKPELFRILWGTLSGAALGGVWRRHGATLGAYGRVLRRALGFGWRGRWAAFAALRRWRLGCLFWQWHLPRLERSYRRLCAAASRWAHLRWMATTARPPRTTGAPRPVWRIDEVPEE